MMTYSDQNIRHVERIFVNVSFSLLLLGPIIVLSWLENTRVKLLIVVGCLLFGAILMSGIATGIYNSNLAVLAGCVAPLIIRLFYLAYH